MRNAFQSLMRISSSMMLALISNVLDDPLQIFTTKTDNSVARLPLQNLLPESDLLIDIVRRSTLQLANPFAERQRWRNGEGQMNMCLYSADRVDECAGCVDDPLFQGLMRNRFYIRREQRRTCSSYATQCAG